MWETLTTSLTARLMEYSVGRKGDLMVKYVYKTRHNLEFAIYISIIEAYI